MNSFERMAEAQLMAYEGQRQLAAALWSGLRRMMSRLLDRTLPQGTMAPW